jgi:flagellar biosynthesis/type III secretory pathway chaperone
MEVLILQPDTLVKKIRDNLVSQKERLTTYLKVLDEENNDIKASDSDKLLEHISIERSIIEELNSFKKVLEPLDLIYNNSPYKKDNTISNLKSKLEQLTTDIKDKQSVNIDLLTNTVDNIGKRLEEISAQNKKNKATYDNIRSSYVDIVG